MSEPQPPVEAEATITLQDLHVLSRQEWFRQLQAFDPTEYSPGFLRRAAAYFKKLAAEVEGYIPMAEISMAKYQAAQDRAHATMHRMMGMDPPPETPARPPGKVLSMVTDETDGKKGEPPPAS